MIGLLLAVTAIVALALAGAAILYRRLTEGYVASASPPARTRCSATRDLMR